MNRKVSYILFLLIVIGSNNRTFAVDLEKRGMTFGVKEEGFVAMMIRKLKNLDLEKENEKMQALARNRVENPVAVDGIKPATKDRSFYYDPTYTLEEDVVLPCGKVLYKAGTKVNPLDHMDLERRIIFVDDRESKQINWLKEILNEKNKDVEHNQKAEDRIILVGGSVLKVQEQIGEQVYFDQMGELTTKFGIKASPAIAVQEGKKLKIEEVKLDD
jgi:conjugal transfer pilus assembly protein TraW